VTAGGSSLGAFTDRAVVVRPAYRYGFRLGLRNNIVSLRVARTYE